MHCGDKSYSIYNDKVYSVIFYSDNFLSHQKHFHFKGTKTNLSAFGNIDEIRVFLSKKCKTNINFQTTSKKKSIWFFQKILRFLLSNFSMLVVYISGKYVKVIIMNIVILLLLKLSLNLNT